MNIGAAGREDQGREGKAIGPPGDAERKCTRMIVVVEQRSRLTGTVTYDREPQGAPAPGAAAA